MSRHQKQPLPAPPPKPKNVQRLEAEMRERRLTSACLMTIWRGNIPAWRYPEMHGALIADNVLAQIAQQQAERQSKILVPKPGMLVPS